MDCASTNFLTPTNEEQNRLGQPVAPEDTTTQDVHVGNVNAVKLAKKLQSEFGSGSYQVHVGKPRNTARLAPANEEL